jgi:formate dehydrogenase (coenzyme F420) beta subunit
MAKTATIDVQDNDQIAALKDLAQSVLEMDEIAAILVPRRLPTQALVMPVLVSDPDQLEGMDPLAPAFAFNAAKMVSRLTRRPAGQKVAVMLRPCEIRAFVELVKLKQGCREDVVIIGYDCPGALTNKDYLTFIQDQDQDQGRESTSSFFEAAMDPNGNAMDAFALAPACRACEQFVPHGADLAVLLYGVDTRNQLLIQATSDPGEAILDRLDLSPTQVTPQRDAVVQAILDKRLAIRDRMIADTTAATNSLEKLSVYLSNCINCYNCRVACPVCYCRECVFVTDVFDHDPGQYLGWAKRKGAIKMPTDTLFYHLTRLAHMSTACVGCGQCSNACPNEVPVMELFRTVALRTQAAFQYQAGKDQEQKPPLSEFREQEFEEVVGI